MAGEAIIVPIILDPKQGLASLKQIGEEGKKVNQQFSGAAGTSNKFGDSMKKTAGNALQLFGAMSLVQGIAKELVSGIASAIAGTNKMASATKMLTDIQRKGAESTREEVVALQTLFAVAKDTSLTYTTRQAAIDKLNKSYPELHKNINLENIGTRETALAIQSVINSLVRKAQLQGIISKIAELSNVAAEATEIANNIGGGQKKTVLLAFIKQTTDRINALTTAAEKLQAVTIGNSAGIGTVFGGKGDEVKVPKVTVRPEKIEIKKPEKFDLDEVYDEIKKSIASAFQDGIEDYSKIRIPKKGYTLESPDSAPGNENIGNDEFEDYLKNLQEALEMNERLSTQISGIVSPAFADMFDAILSKQDALKAFFDAIGQSVKQLIKQLIQAAIQAAVLSLISGGTAKGGDSFIVAFKKIFGFAEGGIVTGPVSALIGEGRTTNANNPEVVAPLDKLKRFFMNISGNNGNYTASGKMGVAGAFMNVPKSVVLYGDGRTLRGVLALEELSQGKNG